MLTTNNSLDKRCKYFQFDYTRMSIAYNFNDIIWCNLIEEFYNEIAPRFALDKNVESYTYVNCWHEVFWIITPTRNLYDIHSRIVPAFLLSFGSVAELNKFKAYYFSRKRIETIDKILQDLESNR